MKWILEIKNEYGIWEKILEYYDENFAIQEKTFYEKNGFECVLTVL